MQDEELGRGQIVIAEREQGGEAGDVAALVGAADHVGEAVQPGEAPLVGQARGRLGDEPGDGLSLERGAHGLGHQVGDVGAGLLAGGPVGRHHDERGFGEGG